MGMTGIELLKNAQDEPVVLDEPEISDICIIEPDTRNIILPDALTIGGVQSDRKAKRIYFSCPRIVGDNLDLSTFQIRINYRNVGSEYQGLTVKDQYICTDAKVDGDRVTFSWQLRRNAARYRGRLQFIVCAVAVDSEGNIDVEWNTTLAQVSILEGIEMDELELDEPEKDVIAQLLEITKETSNKAVQNVIDEKQKALKEIESAKGLPRLDSNGVLIF